MVSDVVVNRRRFDHLVGEVSLAVERAIPRYPLWLELRQLGCDPDHLSRSAAVRFCRGPLQRFLASRGLRLSPRAAKRLGRSVARYEPRFPAPEERLAEPF